MVKHFDVWCNRHNFGFVVEVINGGNGVAASGDAQGLVLDALKREERGFNSIGSPDIAGCRVD